MHRLEPKVGNGKAASARNWKASPTRFSPTVTVLSLISLSCAALFLVVRPNGAQDLPAAKGGAAGHKQVAAASKPVEETPAADTADHPSLDFYRENVRGGMFSEPVPAPAKVEAPAKPKKIEWKPIPVPPVDPLAGWTYTGTVHMGDVTIGLLENQQTRDGQYVKAGDRFQTVDVYGSRVNMLVKSVDDQGVTLANGNKPTTIGKSETIVVTPLYQDAPGKNPAPATQQGQNGQAQAQAATPANGSQFTILGPNGTPISGNQATRYNSRLDRGFNRGGGGNTGGGGRRGRGGFGG